MTDVAVKQWWVVTMDARNDLMQAFTEVGDAARYAAVSAHRADRLTALKLSGAHLVEAVDAMTALPAPPDTVLATMLAGALKHLRTAGTQAQVNDTPDDEFAEHFVRGSNVWRRSMDEALVLMGHAPLGED